jgi:hypothetical protein
MLLSQNNEVSGAPLYQEPLKEHLVNQAALLIGGLAVVTLSFYLLVWLIRFLSGTLEREESGLSETAINLITLALALGVGLWVIFSEVLPKRRFTIMQNEIRLDFPFKGENSGKKRRTIKAEDIVGTKLQFDALSDVWKCRLYLSDEDKYFIEDDSAELLSALKEFYKLNGVHLTVVEEPVYDHWGKRLA